MAGGLKKFDGPGLVIVGALRERWDIGSGRVRMSNAKAQRSQVAREDEQAAKALPGIEEAEGQMRGRVPSRPRSLMPLRLGVFALRGVSSSVELAGW